MRPLEYAYVLLLVTLTLAMGCEKSGEGDEPTPGNAPGNAAPFDVKVSDVPALLAEARQLGEKTWPKSELRGIRVGIEIPPGSRQNTRTVRVGFDFESDPTDATAKSGSILCAPRCQLLRHKVDGRNHAWPACDWARALASARKAGIDADFPLATYGNWSGDSIWVFKNNTNEDRAVAVDATTCESSPRD